MDTTIWFTSAFIFNTLMYARVGAGVNIAYVVGIVSTFMQYLDMMHWGVVEDIMWYFSGVWN